MSYKVKNFFAKMGYVLEKRSLKDKSIFKINLGSSDGIKQGDKFEIISKYSVNNNLTGATDVEKRIIATGKISDKIDPKTCWIIIDDKNDADLIRLGDTVKFKYEKNWFGQFAKFLSNLMN